MVTVTIDKKTGEAIVAELSGALRRPINLMDDTGRIIASTDSARVGTVHEGAAKLIESNMDCLIIKSDEDYFGSKVGINIPIHLDNEIVGVVGVSGENYEGISYYTGLIRATAEALLRDKIRTSVNDTLDNRQRNFLSEILFEEHGVSEERVNSLCRYYGIAPESAYYVMAVMPMNPQDEPSFARYLHIARDRLRKEDGNALFYCAAPYMLVLQPAERERLQRYFDLLQETARRYDVQVALGYDREKTDISGACEAAHRARAACRVARFQHTGKPSCYQELSIELFLPELTERTRRDYIQKVFPNTEGKQLDHWFNLLTAFYRCAGSIERTADALYIHKNTVQYHLRKIAEVTGYDPRNIANATVFQLFLLLYTK